MRFLNIPEKFQSRLSNIFLVALAKSAHLKGEYTSIGNILEVIVHELKILETEGVELPNGQIIRGCLIEICFDNLGGNICFGLSEAFSANYYCRFCVCYKGECRSATKENTAALRDVESYNETLVKIREREADQNLRKKPIDTDETKGVKRPCCLNNLKYYHMLENLTVDPMHDILEGTLSFTIVRIFEYGIKRKLFTFDKLQNMVESFNFGRLHSKNTPSKISLDKKNLGQNAIQMYCLAIHLPFILFNHKSELSDVWPALTTLLQILALLFSNELTEKDLNCLEATARLHLNIVLTVLETHLLPKHHNLIHYSTTIRKMGPIKPMKNMRNEGKHQVFKRFVYKNRNFISLNKSLARKHQEMMCLDKTRYLDNIVASKTNCVLYENFDKYNEICASNNLDDENESDLFVNSLNLNGISYKRGLLLTANSCFIEIDYILSRNNEIWFFSDTSFSVVRKDEFCNSLVLERISSINILKWSELNVKKTYQKIFVGDELHVVFDSLDLSNLIQNM